MVEAGKTNEPVRLHLAQFFQQQTRICTELLEERKRQGEICANLPASTLASLLTSWLEGSLMLASIQKSASSLREERNAFLHLLQAES